MPDAFGASGLMIPPSGIGHVPIDNKYFRSAQQVFMVNFRVRNLDAIAAQLRVSSIDVKIDSEVYPNGRFAR